MLAVLPLAVAGLMLPSRASGAMRPAATAQSGCVDPLSILCPSPSPSPTPSSSPAPSPSPSGSASPSPSASASPTPSATATPSGGASPSPTRSRGAARARRKASSVKAQASAGLMVSQAQFSLVTGSALLVGASYKGVAQVPTAGGGTVPMMWSSL